MGGDGRRGARSAVAKETLDFCAAGGYADVELGPALQAAVQGTVHYPEKHTWQLAPGRPTVEFHNMTTLEALYGPCRELADVGLLNFASAKNPGGGFLGGAQAQEESLARSGGLYPCLTSPQCEAHYAAHRADPHEGFYSHSLLFSPGVPFFRSDDGELQDAPKLCGVVTSPAVNVGVVGRNPKMLAEVVPAMRERLRRVLACFQRHGCKAVILGAWGCGVFKQSPRDVAEFTADAVAGAPFHVVMAMPDPALLAEFQHVFARRGLIQADGLPPRPVLPPPVQAQGRGKGADAKGAGKGKAKGAPKNARWKSRKDQHRDKHADTGE